MLIILSQFIFLIENIINSFEKNFQFTLLPMDLSSAPRIFTQIMKPVFSHVRKLRHSIIAYMDDCFFQKIIGNIVSEMLNKQ